MTIKYKRNILKRRIKVWIAELCYRNVLMASSQSGSAKSRASSLGSAGSQASRTPPSSAGKTARNKGSNPVTESKQLSSVKSQKPSDKLNPKTVDPVSRLPSENLFSIF